MKRLFGLMFGVLLALSQVSAASAATVVTNTGTHGSWFVTDSDDSPAAKCGYGAEFAPDYAYFRWLKVAAPLAFATDSHPSMRDSQKVSLQFKIQRQLNMSGVPWKTVASSSVQRATAFDDQAAPFKSMTLYWKGENAPGPDRFSQFLRALVTIKWYAPGGSVAGTVQYVPDHYSAKAFGGTSTGIFTHCSAELSAG